MIHVRSWCALKVKPEADQLKRANGLAKQLGVGIIAYGDVRRCAEDFHMAANSEAVPTQVRDCAIKDAETFESAAAP